MRVFLDTNVLVSAFATRGLCADVVRHVLTEHVLITGEVVLGELRRALRSKLRLPAETVGDIEEFLREGEVVPKPERPSGVAVRDPDDGWILASALEGHADVLVTGDSDLLELGSRAPLPIVDPRSFWLLARRRPHT
ncbi:MAG: putative toxin-antitoxin system toxin component, PIN family [Candidatus Eisenbacteria bacterium]|nr:putative toxin-antitoxin system toxin component, PIN family [Candidatus Latescibacterota bacterium]MBD3302624.1 putative toxin-antitoxin system toxin component, PIN family [Candidatus Eisenbacteria bacterium]